MSLRFRINLLITALMLLFIMAMGIIIVDDTRKSIKEEMEGTTRVTAQLLTTVLYSSQFIPGTATQRQMILDFLKNLGRVRASDIKLYDGIGTLIYESPLTQYKAGRWAPQWFSRLVAPKVDILTLTIQGGTLVITPDASRSVLDAWDDLQNLIWLALGFFIAVNVLVFWFTGRSLRPLNQILDGLSQMEQGNFGVRLPKFPLPELSSISHTFNRMAGALQDSMAENRRLALIVTQASDAIMIHDLKGNISFWNPAAERLFGYTAGEVVGRSATLLAPAGRENEIKENLEIVVCRSLVENVETQRLAKDGRLIDVSLSAAPLIDPHNEYVIGEICSMRDITEKKRAQQAARELEENRKLTQLIQSHVEEERRSLARELHDELGQYVTAIKTIGASIANRSGSAPEVRTSAQTIVDVAARIYGAMHGIISRLRPSALDYLGLTETLQDSIAAWQSRHPELKFKLDISGMLDDFGETINITVYRIVQECLTNVVRHAQASNVKIAVQRLRAERGGGEELQLVVCDDGKGTPEEAKSEGHFGLLGMRERVQALNGSFRIDNAPDRGFCVNVTLPIEGKK
ncbi:MAG TPA: PAS domain S-box protein [Burkholderiales bacterium]|nr:PAS domain S-box protein [Burkholderiales bacterium]